MSLLPVLVRSLRRLRAGAHEARLHRRERGYLGPRSAGQAGALPASVSDVIVYLLGVLTGLGMSALALVLAHALADADVDA